MIKTLITRYQEPMYFGVIGLISAGLGLLLLDIFVEIIKIEKNMAYGLQLAIVLFFNFNLNNWFTWKCPTNNVTTYLARLWRYIKSRTVNIFGSQLVFTLGVTFVDIDYNYVFLFDSFIWMVFNYLAGKYYVFKPTEAA
jgi:putative flippase GtrA